MFARQEVFLYRQEDSGLEICLNAVMLLPAETSQLEVSCCCCCFKVCRISASYSPAFPSLLLTLRQFGMSSEEKRWADGECLPRWRRAVPAEHELLHPRAVHPLQDRRLREQSAA